jgi:hypothetical protein
MSTNTVLERDLISLIDRELTKCGANKQEIWKENGIGRQKLIEYCLHIFYR